MPHFRKHETCAFLVFALLPQLFVAAVLWVLPVDAMAVDRAAGASRDYTSMWAAGHLVANGGLEILFDRANFNAALRAMFGAGFPEQVWSYPPPALLLAVPFAALPLVPGFLVWTAGTAAALWLALRAGRLSRVASLAVLLSPAVADNALTGQNGALTGALLIGGLLLVDRRPMVSGVLLGALVFKPQLGLLAPVCLIASCNWRAFGAAAISAATLVVASALLFGFGAWTDFFARTQPTLASIMAEPWDGRPLQRLFASPLMAARSLGLGLSIAEAVQLAVCLLCGVIAWRAWRMPAVDPLLRVALTGPLAMAAAPWVHTYDMVPLTVAVVILFMSTRRHSPLLLGFAWFWPGAAVLLPIPLVAEVASVAGIAWLAWREVHAASECGDLVDLNAAAARRPA